MQVISSSPCKHARSVRILLEDVVIRCPPGGHNSLPVDARLSIEVVVDGNKVRTTKPLMQESTGSSWRLGETIELWVAFTSSMLIDPATLHLRINKYSLSTHRFDNITIARLIVTMECPGCESQQLGFTDLTGTDLLALCAQENYSMVYIHLHAYFPHSKFMDVLHRVRSRTRQDK